MGMPEEAYTQGIRANLDQFVHQVVQVFLVGLLIGMERNILPPMATRNFGVAENSFLFLLTFVLGFGLVKGALNFVAGTLADRIGRKPVLLTGWLIALPIPFVLLFARNWWWVVFANMLLGINQGFALSMTVTSKVDITRSHQRGSATGINETAGYLAVGVAGVATGYLASRFGSRETLFVFGLVVILTGLTLAIFRIRETLPWAKAEHARLKGNPRSQDMDHRFGISSEPGAREVFRLVSFGNPTFRALSQAGVANKIADTLVWALFPVFFSRHHLGVIATGWVTGTYAMVWGLSQLWTGTLSDRIGRKPAIVSGLWVLAAAIAGMALSSSLVPWIVWAAVMGMGMALLYPTLIASVADLASPAWRGKALGTYRYWRDTGYAIGAFLLGLAAQETHHILTAFWTTVLILVVSGGWVLFGAAETLPPFSRNTPISGEGKKVTSLAVGR
ncbi:MAG: MFS transporter [Nitrospirota bacterium]|nr:MFS transporter [Nitrospirota bacterium]